MRIDIKKGIPLIVHFLFCTAIMTIPLLVMSRNGMIEYKHYLGYVIRTSMLISLFYFNYLLLIDKFLFKKQFIQYVVVNICLILGVILLQNLLMEMIFIPSPMMEKGQDKIIGPPHELRLLGDCLLIIFVIGMSVALKATKRWYRDSINLELVKASQLEADLRNLRNQLNPHFLFNTLNNIYSLIAIDTHKAQDSVHMLSNLLRYVLYDNDHKFVPIDKELEFTQNYIDLMRLRLSPKFKLDVLIKNENHDIEIASLLFITLIENAFKHGISSGENSFIDIKIYVGKEKSVLCTVENSLDISNEKGVEATKKTGIGLANLSKRLELLYHNNYNLRIEKREKSYFVLLCVNFDKTKFLNNEIKLYHN